MKTIYALIFTLLIAITTNAQINIETNFDESVYEASEQGNKVLFKRLSKGKIGSTQFLKKATIQKQLMKKACK